MARIKKMDHYGHKYVDRWLCRRFDASCGINLSLTSLLVCAADDFDFVGVNRVLVVELEVDIFDGERPHVVAESVGVKMALATVSEMSAKPPRLGYLERKPRLDSFRDRFDEGFVEVADDLHGELGLDLVVADEVVQSVCKRDADTVSIGK